ncbi:MAG: hypothetical protein HYT88_06365 [Candidatus Omnitrophica bacterium]|nr:hypothetical protein [Candidatus Omnitrophota bacterium]MBI2174178.1 hypothetical protein [Candidatus Omnitrophota bacterium]MBI3009466.1 hypothetical protein [Candidatus Omnitrophota bacterium]
MKRSSAPFRRKLGQLRFPYLKDAYGHHAPIVYLQVWTGNRWLYLQAYVDSGASWSVFHSDVAQLLGIKLNRVKRRYMTLGNGSVLPIYLKAIRVRFAGDEFSVPAGFSDALGMGFNLMGRAGFFDRFSMCFNDRARSLTVTRLS